MKKKNKGSRHLDEVSIQDIINIDFLQQFQDSIANALGIAIIAVDVDGIPITKPSNFTRFCMEYTRGSNIGLACCIACDRAGGMDSARTGQPSIYQCHVGLTDFVTPIMLDNKQIGSIFGGQVVTSEPDEAHMRAVSRELGVDGEGYLAAFFEVKRLPHAKLEAAANVMYLVVGTLSKLWYQQQQITTMIAAIDKNIRQVSAALQELAASAGNVSLDQKKLCEEVENVNIVSEKIKQVMDLIREIADETRLLGLDAAIEAARAGQVGLRFHVVAQEIRKLSEASKDTVSEIKEFTEMIQQSVAKTVAMGQGTAGTVEQQAMAIEEVVASMQHLTDLTQQLEVIAVK